MGLRSNSVFNNPVIIDPGAIENAQGPLQFAEGQFRGTATLPDAGFTFRGREPGEEISTIDAGFRRENFMASIMASRHQEFEREIGYNPYDPEQEDIEGFPLDLFGNSASAIETEFLKEQYLSEMADLQLLYDSGWRGIASQVAGGFLSPENLIPLGSLFRFGRAAKKGLTAGVILRGTGLGLAAGAVSEAALQPTQLTRTTEETVANIIASGMFGSFIGSAAFVIGRTRQAIARELAQTEANLFAQGRSGDLSAAINRNIEPDDLIAQIGEDPSIKSARVWGKAYRDAIAEVNPAASEVLKLRAPENIFGRIAKNIIKFTPGNYVAGHPVTAFRAAGEELGESRLLTKNRNAGDPVATSLEARSNRLARLASGSMGDMTAILREARTSKSFKSKISDDDWWDMVGDAMKRGDSAENLTQDKGIRSAVEAANREWRKFMAPLTDEMIRLKMLRSTDLKGTATSYFPRMPDPIKVKQDIVEVDGQQLSLNQVVRDHLAGQADPFAKANARRTVSYMSGGSFSPTANFDDVPGFVGPLKGRGLLLPDIALEPWMVRDPRIVLPLFMSRVGPQLVFSRSIVAESPMFHKLDEAFESAQKKAIDENDYTHLVGVDEDAQHLMSAGILDATRDPNHFKIARIIDSDIAELQVLRPKSINATRAVASIQSQRDVAEELLSGGIKTARQKVRDAQAIKSTGKKITPSELKRVAVDEITDAELRVLQKEGPEGLVAKRKRTVDLLVKAKAVDLEAINARLSTAKESRSTTNKSLKLVRADLKGHRKVAMDVHRTVEKATKPGAKTPVKSKVDIRKLPVTERQKAKLVERVRNTVFKTGNIESKRNIDGSMWLHPTEGPLGRDLARMVELEPSPRKKAALEKQGVKGFAALRGMRDRIQHRHANMYRDPLKWAQTVEVMRGTRQYLFSTDLMNVVLTSLTDTSSSSMVAGAENYAAAFIHRMKDPMDIFLRNSSNDTIITAMASHELGLHGNRASMITEGFEMGISSTTLGRGMDFLSRKAASWSGLNMWNAQGKATTGLGVQTRIINEINALVHGKATDIQKTNLAQAGIDEEIAERIWAQYSRWRGDGDTGARLQIRQPKMDDWEDPGARETMETAIVSDTNRGVLTPSVGNIPLFMDQEWAKLSFMYKNFLFDATNKLMIMGIQRAMYLRDLSVLMHFTTAIGTGMMLYYIRTKLAGREVSDDPAQWAFEGVDRSGWGGMPLDLANMMNAATGGAISEALGGEPSSRYISRGGIKAFTGALGGAVDDAFSVGRDVISGDVTGTTLDRAAKNTPIINFIPIRKLFVDPMRDAFINFTGLPENGVERRARERRDQGIFGVQE